MEKGKLKVARLEGDLTQEQVNQIYENGTIENSPFVYKHAIGIMKQRENGSLYVEEIASSIVDYKIQFMSGSLSDVMSSLAHGDAMGQNEMGVLNAIRATADGTQNSEIAQAGPLEAVLPLLENILDGHIKIVSAVKSQTRDGHCVSLYYSLPEKNDGEDI